MIAGAIGVVAILAVVLGIALVNRGGHGDSSPTSAVNTANPNDGPFSGVFRAEIGAGPVAYIEGTPAGVDAPSVTMTFALRSACTQTGCVATAVRLDSSNTDPMWTERLPDAAPFVFDDVDGRWVAVTTAPGKCNNAGKTEDVERWKMFSLQQRPDGSLSGEYIYFDAGGCNGKRAVTLKRVRDVTAEDEVADPSNLAPRVASPAAALWGRYHYTSSGVTATKTEYDLAGLTACLRTGDRCMSYLQRADGCAPSHDVRERQVDLSQRVGRQVLERGRQRARSRNR